MSILQLWIGSVAGVVRFVADELGCEPWAVDYVRVLREG